MTGYVLQEDQDNGNPTPDILQHTFMTRSTLYPQWGQNAFEAAGEDVFTPPYYSKYLIQLVHRCLAWNHVDRPQACELWRIIKPIIETYDTMNGPNANRVHLDDPEPNRLPQGRRRQTAQDPVPAFTAQAVVNRQPGIPLPAQLDIAAPAVINDLFQNQNVNIPQVFGTWPFVSIPPDVL
jgi:hypothetical protein